MENKIEIKLREAYSKLVSKSTEKLTVSSLCEKADVSRAGFYLYYKDLDDFIAACRSYIIKKLCEQLEIAMNTVDPKEYKMIFSENDIKLLKEFTGKHDYWDFALMGNKVIWPKIKSILVKYWGEEYFNRNNERFEFMITGSIAALYFDIINYDKETFYKHMIYTNNLVNELFPKKINIRYNKQFSGNKADTIV